jgi:hypothetical protein
MGEEKVVAKPPFFEQAVSQSPDPRTRVNDDDLIIPGTDFHAGGVSPVPQVFQSANRGRTSRAPAPNDHFLFRRSRCGKAATEENALNALINALKCLKCLKFAKKIF